MQIFACGQSRMMRWQRCPGSEWRCSYKLPPTLGAKEKTRRRWGTQPGDERYFRLAIDVAQNFKPLDAQEEQALLSGGKGVEPVFHLGNDV